MPASRRRQRLPRLFPSRSPEIEARGRARDARARSPRRVERTSTAALVARGRWRSGAWRTRTCVARSADRPTAVVVVFKSRHPDFDFGVDRLPRLPPSFLSLTRRTRTTSMRTRTSRRTITGTMISRRTTSRRRRTAPPRRHPPRSLGTRRSCSARCARRTSARCASPPPPARRRERARTRPAAGPVRSPRTPDLRLRRRGGNLRARRPRLPVGGQAFERRRLFGAETADGRAARQGRRAARAVESGLRRRAHDQ